MNLEDRVVAWLANQDVHACLVGGCVRDRVLERAVQDLDVAVSGDGAGLARQLADDLDADYYTLDRERGVGRAILRRTNGERLTVDIASFRGGDLAADLAGRDLTINALAVNVRVPTRVIDLHGGLNDLDAGVIRAVSDDAIRSDPLRALRAVRQAAQLGFTLASETEALIRRDGVALANVSAERICDELSKLLACASSAPYLFELDRLGLLVTILPELEPLRDLRQSPPHQHAVLKHSLETVAALEFLLGELGYTAASREGTGNEPLGAGPELGSLLDYAGKIGEHLDAVVSDTRRRVVALKMAALLHDVGKSGAHSVDGDERIRFLGHEQAGSRVAGLSLQRLRFSSAEARLVETIVRCHMRPLTLASQDRVSTRALYRFFRDAGDAGVDVLLLSLADHLATYAAPSGGSGWQPLVGLVMRMLTYYWEQQPERTQAPPLVDGHDLLQRFGLEPGPQIGRLLEAVREAQAIGQVCTRDEAIELVKCLLDG